MYVPTKLRGKVGVSGTKRGCGNLRITVLLLIFLVDRSLRTMGPNNRHSTVSLILTYKGPLYKS